MLPGRARAPGSDRAGPALAGPSQDRASVREPRRPTATRYDIMQMGSGVPSRRASLTTSASEPFRPPFTGRARAPVAPPLPSSPVERVDIPYTTATSILDTGSRDKPKHRVPWRLLRSPGQRIAAAQRDAAVAAITPRAPERAIAALLSVGPRLLSHSRGIGLFLMHL